ncbi:MAG: methyltransferase domain-containing protein [Planctomycetes bacterium]|nr:methyltransferase domain-containing protein [Planctomycetota bacterium]
MATRWTAERLLEMVRAFQPACVVAAAAELDVFSALQPRPATAQAVAARLKTDRRGTTMLLDALVALGLLTKRGERYGLAPGVADALTEGSPANVLPMARHLGTCLRRWAQLARVVKTGRLARPIPSVGGRAAERAAFIGAMHVINVETAPKLVAALGPPRFRHLLDVGGGSGTWTIAFLRGAPGATATIFDLPPVAPMARRRIAAEGLAGRVSIVAGDYTKDELPRGADLAWVSAIIHQEPLAGIRALFRKVFDALAPGGRILVRDIVMGPSRTRPVMGALFAINMLAGTDAGGTYTFAEQAGALEAAGFVRPRVVHNADDMSAVVGAVKPK